MKKNSNIGILMPGDMGHGIGKVLIDNDFSVFTYLKDRSERTKTLAKEANIKNFNSFKSFLDNVDIILSIIPPEKALEQAKFVGKHGTKLKHKITYVDCNAISPSSCLQIEKLFDKQYFNFVDGGIIGLNPIIEKGQTRLYLSGNNTEQIEALNNKGIIVKKLGSSIGKASALKMIYASATKATFALHAAVITAASKCNLFNEYVDELKFSKPDILKAMEKMVPKIPLDAQRWEGEMYEIAKTYDTLNITPKFHEASAEIMKLAQKTSIANESRQNYDESRTLNDTVKLFVEASKKS